jgi:hypothetical protein
MPPGYWFVRDEEDVLVLGEEAGKAFARSFSRPRVLAWKRGPFCVYPVHPN